MKTWRLEPVAAVHGVKQQYYRAGRSVYRQASVIEIWSENGRHTYDRPCCRGEGKVDAKDLVGASYRLDKDET